MKRMLSRTALPVGATLFAALVALYLAVAAVTGAFMPAPESEWWYSHLTPDGELKIARVLPASGVQRIYNRDFELITEDTYRTQLEGLESAYFHTPFLEPDFWRGWRWRTPLRYVHSPPYWPALQVLNAFREDREAPGSNRVWFWLPDRRVFAAYDRHSKLPRGCLGADGFARGNSVEPFPDVLSPLLLTRWWVRPTSFVALPTRNAAYLVRLADEKVLQLTQKGGGDVVDVGVAPLYDNTGGLEDLREKLRVYVRHTDRIQCFDVTGKQLGAVELTARERDAAALSCARTGEGTFILTAWSPEWFWLEGARRLDGATVRWVGPSGETTDSTQIRVPDSLMTPRPIGPLVKRCLTATVPLYAAAKEVLNPAPTRDRSWLVLVLSALVAGACAAVVWWHASGSFVERGRRHGWTALAFIGGVPGLLTYFALAPGPELEKCAKCVARKPLSDRECPHCGAPVPRPSPTGCEIFA